MIRVIMADDHDLIRNGFRKLVADQPDITVVGEAKTAVELEQLLERTHPHLLILDISLPDKSGLDVLRDLSDSGYLKTLRVLVLSMHPESRYARRVIAAGAAGYMTKDTAGAELVGAIRKVCSGGHYISEVLAEELADEVAHPEAGEPHTTLSDREYQLLLFLGDGKSVREIAEQLHLSINTVNSYRSRLLEKMGLHSNAEIIRYVLRHNLID